MSTLVETASSRVVERCQVCDSNDLQTILFLGYLPPVNTMHPIGTTPREQAGYPASLLYCSTCHLVQLGLVVDARILFPPEYPYTSSTTRILRDNFAELAQECGELLDLARDDLVVDVGSNDGNLLSNFKTGHRVLGITPEQIGRIAIERGIPTVIDYLNRAVVKQILQDHGSAKLITATNVFAHIDDVHEAVQCILELLDADGTFVTESHYLLPLIETVQYDTIYHEHLRYYSLHSLKYLLEMHDLEVFHAKRIPSHGGSVRVYAARKGVLPVRPSVAALLDAERDVVIGRDRLLEFRDNVVRSKLGLMKLLGEIKSAGGRVHGISAPSRASTLINYCGIDDGILDCVLEIPGSHKIGKYVPGTRIPVVDEARLFEDQPEYALVLSWHIADELMPKLTARGFKGKYIIPLPDPRLV
jgi:hypothetical protein